MRLEKFLLVGLAGLVTACAGPVEPDDEGYVPADAVTQTEQPVIVGTVDWVSSTTLSGTEAARASAVGYLQIPAVGSRCTAWLVAADVVITNNHCIGSASQAAGARVSFNYVDGVASSSRVWYDCSTFIKTWSAEDMTALRCAALNGVLPGTAQGFLTLAASNPPLNQNLYVLHQNCDYYTSSGCSPTKKYSPGKVTNTAYDTLNIAYNADTLGGSSGSPVLAKDGADAHKVIALHHWGFGGNSSGRGTGNGGVKVSALRTRLAEIGIGGGGGGGTGTVLLDRTGLSGASGTWQHFAITVPSGKASLNVNMSGGTGDADLYVRQGSQPTTSSYNCRPYLNGNTETCTLSNPVAGTWYVSVRAYTAYSGVALKASVP